MYVGMKPLKKAVKYKIQAVIAFCISQEGFLLYEISLLHQSERRATGIHPLLKVRIQFKNSRALSFVCLAAGSKGFRGCFDSKQREF